MLKVDWLSQLYHWMPNNRPAFLHHFRIFLTLKEAISRFFKHPNNNRHRRRRFIPFIIAFLVVILFACIAAILLGILYKSQQQITTLTTTSKHLILQQQKLQQHVRISKIFILTLLFIYLSACSNKQQQHRQVRLSFSINFTSFRFLPSEATSTSTGTSTTSSTTTATTTVTTTTTTTTTTDTTTTTTTTACYFGQDYVDLVEGGRRQISRLKTGDQVWTISHDGKRLIQDEIMCIPHAGPTTPTYFYTFKTLEEHTISLTDSHFILAMAKDEDKIKIIRASEVTLEHRLIMNHRTIGIEQIVYSERIGFYSPITLSGYLTVNNLSTSVYVEFLHAPHGFLHQITGPFRIYYRIARWLFGNNYAPFGITVKDEIHPISSFIVANYEPIRLVFTSFPLIKPIMFIVSFIYAIKHILLYKKKTVII
ncbi:unnamed protein product [Rotaria magnacalcarata]